MKLKFSYLSIEKPYTAKNGVVYNKINALIDLGAGARLCVVAISPEAAAKIHKLTPMKEVEGEFDIVPSYERKSPVLELQSI